jgi:hypothetical protein
MKELNTYETKQAERKTRYAEKAKKLKAEAGKLYKYDCHQMSQIPPGQPILIGHHSEKRHRNDLERSHARMRKIMSLTEKAEYYEQRAAFTTDAISSDDEDAITKLNNKLARLAQKQIDMKRINQEYRKSGSLDTVTGITEEMKEVFKNFFILFPYEKMPYPPYKFTNNGAKIRRLKQRIAALEKKQKTAAREDFVGKGYTIQENKEDNRIWVIFDAKPSREICQIMKHNGFKWSPSRSAWVRMLNSNGQGAANNVVEEISALESH